MLRTVEIFEYKNKSGQVNLVSKNEFGLFHKWGDEIHAENPDGNSVSETVAIVEMKDGSIRTIFPPHIKFLKQYSPIQHSPINDHIIRDTW